VAELDDFFKKDSDEAAPRHWLLVLQVQREEENREEKEKSQTGSQEQHI
jgi:hypothetical protein